jgi:hypothetical protein
LLSACGHLIEYRLSGANPWVAVAIYLHVAGLGALLLSGFWSLASEVFDPQAARSGYGRIAAAGTIGGLLGGLAIERTSQLLPDDFSLLLLAGFHAGSAAGAFLLGREARGREALRFEKAARPAGPLFDLAAFRSSPHLRTIAALVALSTAGAFLIEYLFQSGAKNAFPNRADLQQFLARFYVVVGLSTSLAQMAAGWSVRRVGIGSTIASLPMGLGSSAALALVFQAFPMIMLVRGIESALRASLFRSGYELLFVPMDPEEKRRVKTFLDVACDRAGDAIGAMIVQAMLLVAVQFSLMPFLPPALLALVVVMTMAGFWVASRLDRLYLGVVERRLARQAEHMPLVVPSEAGWTVIGLPVAAPPTPAPSTASGEPAGAVPPPAAGEGAHGESAVSPATFYRHDDPRLASLVELRSGDRLRVQAALVRLDRPDRMQMAQVVSLLAWDDVSADARLVLERHAGWHIGLLVDALADPETDFAIRRRLPRVLGTVASPRAIEGLVWGLEDERFEVRYQSARAIERLLWHHPELTVDSSTIMRAVDRELSVPARVWHAHQLIDRVEQDDAAGSDAAVELPASAGLPRRNLEHVFTLLSTILPREAVQVAHRGIQSAEPHMRALALEYLDRVLPPDVRAKLLALVDEASASRAASSGAGTPAPQGPIRPSGRDQSSGSSRSGRSGRSED